MVVDDIGNLSIDPKIKELMDKLDTIKEQISILIEDREYLVSHKYKYLKTDYILKVGGIEYDLFEVDCKIGRIRRKIAMVQAFINQQAPIDLILIEKKLDKEFKDYMKTLEDMAKDKEVANILKNSKSLTNEEVIMLKKLYRQLVKKLHPDLNLNPTEKQKSLWERIVKAYETSNIDMLEILGEMVGKEGEEIVPKDNINELQDKVQLYETRIQKLLKEISEIQNTFPFNLEENLNDEKWVQDRQDTIGEKLLDGKIVLKELEDYLLLILPTNSKFNN